MDTEVWEPVLSMIEFYDGPRKGVACYQGKPHRYQSFWEESREDWVGEWCGGEFMSLYWLTSLEAGASVRDLRMLGKFKRCQAESDSETGLIVCWKPSTVSEHGPISDPFEGYLGS